MSTLLRLAIVLQAAFLRLSAPTVTIDSAIVTGVNSGSVDKFLGIPFALPPIGDRRFRKPYPHPAYTGSIGATAYGPACIRQKIEDLPQPDIPENEDCLTVNVIRPSTASSNDKFPVVVWIHGGGFETDTSSAYDDMGVRIVQRSLELSSPVIFVSMSYRLSAYGFLASKEVMAEQEGNMGLLDQRLALTWVQNYIKSFGGDESNVMLWGQSAGAISAAMQMLAYGGTTSGLFNSAFMMSGGPIPTGDMTGGQKYYDFLVNETGCSNTNNTLHCLRHVPIDNLRAAVDKTPNFLSFESLALAWAPRADGVFLSDAPLKLVQQGKVASIPFVSGNCDDEGTTFSFIPSKTVITEEDFHEYIRTVYFSSGAPAELEPLWEHYPSDPEKGSPFDTGRHNVFKRQFKRLAAFQGDAVFQAPRRFFLEQVSGRMKTWSYLSKRNKATLYRGSYHGSDLDLNLLDEFVIKMAVNHDPNTGDLYWPQYTNQERSLYTFTDFQNDSITFDTYRKEPIEFVTKLSLAHPVL